MNGDPLHVSHWAVQAVDDLMRKLDAAGFSGTVTCASGISPSGTIHLGNLREAFTTHVVAEELRRRGVPVRHIHSWDDYDRLRKIPANLPPEWQQFIGMPLCAIPDPTGESDSFASHNIDEFLRAIEVLGVQLDGIRQGAAYQELRYNGLIEIAMAKRLQIFDILAQYRGWESDAVKEAERERYYPYKVFCQVCNRDSTDIRVYDQETSTISYTCRCGHEGVFSLKNACHGKLVWKVDWPMRWCYEDVKFEPGGEDHATPGSSYTVGRKIAQEVFGCDAPSFVMYGFVGALGTAKISSSVGTAMTPLNALEVFEPAMLRWLYLRRPSGQKFSLDFGAEVLRTYDEWDSLLTKKDAGNATPLEQYWIVRSTTTSLGQVPMTHVRAPFRVLAAASDLTQGHVDQIVRIAGAHIKDANAVSADDLQPRLSCAANWVLRYQPESERTHVRQEFAEDVWSALPELQQRGIGMIFDLASEEDWNLENLTKTLYGVPKLLMGLPLDAKPNEELKRLQREFFVAIYELTCASDTGPRLPTLFISLGRDRIQRLLLPNPR